MPVLVKQNIELKTQLILKILPRRSENTKMGLGGNVDARPSEAEHRAQDSTHFENVRKDAENFKVMTTGQNY